MLFVFTDSRKQSPPTPPLPAAKQKFQIISAIDLPEDHAWVKL